MQDEPALLIPRHIGVIADGNRRWAKQHGLPAWEGHLAGYTALKDFVFTAVDAGVEVLTVYTWSTENWRRSEQEVGKMMKLVVKIFTTDLKEFVDKQIRIRILGVPDGLSDNVLDAFAKAQAATEHLTRGTLCICFNYGGRRELLDAMRALLREGADPDSLTEDDIAAHLYAPDVPPIDIVLRTSGEQRLSNFLLWQVAYSELMFVDRYLPDLRHEDLQLVFSTFTQRKRRFGS